MPGLGNRNQGTPKKPWEILGITEEEYNDKTKRADENIKKLFEDVAAPYLAAMKKFEPMIQRMPMADFVGLKMAVDRELPRRHAHNMATNPFYAMAAEHDAARRNPNG